MRHVNAEASSSRVTLDDVRAPKVSQVDSEELDEGLVQMLGERVEKAFGNFKSEWKTSLRPEIGLVLKLIIFKYSFFGSKTASPGSKLQNLKLVGPGSTTPSRRRLLLFLLLHPPMFPSYILIRLREYGLSDQWPDAPLGSWQRGIWKAITRLENFARLWELGGWLALLWDGRYPSLLMRLLGLRLIPASQYLTKLVSYEFMNRQLVWNTFTEFAMFAYPFLPSTPSYLRPSTLKAPIRSLLSLPTGIDYSSIPLSDTRINGKQSLATHSGPLADLPSGTCPICHLRTTSTPVPLAAGVSLPPVSTTDTNSGAGSEEERIFVPAQTDCWGGCRWCYYCIMGELASLRAEAKATSTQSGETVDSPKWDCLRCGGTVTRAWRAGPGVAPDASEQAFVSGDTSVVREVL